MSRIAKAHADALVRTASAYFRAKSHPKNFCKKPEDVDEGRDLLKAFDDAVDDGMDPDDGSSLICKCAGAMGGAMAGPLAATLATRPVKKLADGTVMEGQNPERRLMKSYVHTHTRTLKNGKVIVIGQYNTKKLPGPQHLAGSDAAMDEAGVVTSQALADYGDLNAVNGEDPSVQATYAKDAIHAVQTSINLMKHSHATEADGKPGADYSPGLEHMEMLKKHWEGIHDGAIEAMHSPDKLHGGPQKGSGHFAMEKGKAKYVPGEAPDGAHLASVGHQVALGENKNKGWYLRATNAAHANIIRGAYHNITGDEAPASEKIGASNHFGKEGSFPHIFFGQGEDAKKLAVQVLAEVHRMYPVQKSLEGENAEKGESITPSGVEMTLPAATKEHQELVDTLEHPTPDKVAEEIKDQGGELKEMKAAASIKSPYEMGKEAHENGQMSAPLMNTKFSHDHLLGKTGSEIKLALAAYTKGWTEANLASRVPEDGPKEGDLKDGLTFHDGRWHNDKPGENEAKGSESTGSMPTVAELVGIGGKEWEKNGKHRIYFNDLEQFCPDTGLPKSAFKGKAWYDYKDQQIHTEGIYVTAEPKVIEGIKAKAKEWGAEHEQTMAEPEAPAAKYEPKASAAVQAMTHDIKESIRSFKGGATQASAGALAHSLTDHSMGIDLHHAGEDPQAHTAALQSIGAENASLGSGGPDGSAEAHKKAAAAHAKATVIHGQLGNTLPEDVMKLMPPPAPSHLQEAHAWAAKGHAHLSKWHLAEASKLDAAPKDEVPKPQVPKKPWHEHDFQDIATKVISGKMGAVKAAVNSGHTVDVSKEDLEEFVARTKHLAVVAMHKSKAGMGTFDNGDTPWEDIAKSWAEQAKKGMAALAKKG
jgi:hypothetical protein